MRDRSTCHGFVDLTKPGDNVGNHTFGVWALLSFEVGKRVASCYPDLFLWDLVFEQGLEYRPIRSVGHNAVHGE